LPQKQNEATREGLPARPENETLEAVQSGPGLTRYWRANVLVMIVLLSAWALAGLGCGILWADTLNEWSVGGYPLGFWFAQQGAIVVFLLLVLLYALILNRLDRQHHRRHQAQHAADRTVKSAARGEAEA